jgi:hypothetical protein
MIPARLAWLQRALMALVSALLFVGLFRLNDWLFASLEHIKGVNWVFLPGGFRVLLVLVLGWPGALGIALGTLWLDGQSDVQSPLWHMALTALASGFGPWLVKRWLERRGDLSPDLQQLTSASLLHFVLVYAAFNALAHQTIAWFFEQSRHQVWIHVWPMFTGDLLGAIIVLYTLKLSLPWLKNLVRPGL